MSFMKNLQIEAEELSQEMGHGGVINDAVIDALAVRIADRSCARGHTLVARSILRRELRDVLSPPDGPDEEDVAEWLSGLAAGRIAEYRSGRRSSLDPRDRVWAAADLSEVKAIGEIGGHEFRVVVGGVCFEVRVMRAIGSGC